MQHNKRNIGVDLFRIVLIFLIVLHHYTVRYSQLFSPLDLPYRFEKFGFIGNSMFMMISGFFLANSFCSNSESPKIFKYVINHWWRLFPVAAICVTITFVVTTIVGLPGRTVSIYDYFLNLLIIHPGIPFVDGSHWFISSLLQMQLLLSPIFLIKREHDRLMVLVSICLLSIVLYIIGDVPNTKIDNLINTLICTKWLHLLLVGAITSWIINSKINVYFVFIPFFWVLYISITRSSYFLPLFYLLFLFLIKNDFSFWGVSNRNLGQISLCWYLLHQNIGYCIIYLFQKNNFTIDYRVVLLVCLVTLLLSILIAKISMHIPSKLIK